MVIVDTILVDTADMQPKLGTITDLGSGTTIGDNLSDMAGATFSSATDSLEAIRNRGDAAWTTGAGTGLTALASGTAQAGTASTIQLAAGETFADDELNGNIVKVTSGTGAGQARVIVDYTGATDTADIYPNWATNPDATSVYEVVEGSMNMATVSLDGPAADNLELDYDGTGYAKTNSTVGTVTSVTNQVSADMTAISGDTTAADNFETMLDGTGKQL